MKIDRLEVSNIASLRGDHVIDFQNVLAKEGLFAITGPTGSGKSTLLSVISLALYGQGGKKGLNAGDYVSEGAAAGEINLYFRMGSNAYRANWQCTLLKKNGTPLSKITPKKYLEDLQTGEVLNTNASDIIKLTFDQFNQCVILHQGEFANFLGSTFSNRRAILEKLINISEIDRIKKTYDDSNKLLESEIKSLSDRLEANQIFSSEEVADLNLQEKSLNKILESYQEEASLQASIRDHFVKINDYVISYEGSLKKSETTTKQLEEYTGDYQNAHLAFKKSEEAKLEIEKRWKSERVIASLALENENKRQNHLNLLKRITLEITNLNSKITGREEEIKSIRDALNDMVFDYSTDFLAQNIALHQELQAELKALYDGSTTIQSHHKRIETLENELKNSFDNALEIKKGLGENPEVELLKLKQDLNQLESRDLDCEEKLKALQNIKTRLEVLMTNLQTIELKRSELDQELKSFSQLEDLKELLEQKKTLLEKERQIYEHSQTIQMLKQLSLQNDECELCGQKHPTLKEHTSIELFDPSPLLKEIENANSKITIRETKQQQLKETQEQASAIALEIKKLLDHAQISTSDNPLEAVAHDYKKLELAKSEIKANKTAIADRHLVLSVGIEKLKNLREAYQRTQTQKRELEQHGMSLNEKLNSILKSRTLYEELIIDSENISYFRAKLERNLALYEKKLIQEKHIKREEKELSEYKAETEQNISHQKQLEDECAKIQKLIPSQYMDKNIKMYIEEQDELIKTNREEIWAQERSLDEKKLACERTKEALSHIHDNLKNSKNQLVKLKEELLLKLEDLFKQESSHTPHNESLKAILTKGLGPLHEIKSEILSEILTHTIDPWLANFKKEMLSTSNKLAEIKSKLELHDSRSKLGESLRKELNEKGQKFKLYQNLKDFFAKNDFKNYILSLIEEELIASTNEELQKLCEGRYVLKSRQSSNGPEFIVIDHWISFSERKVASLSGGETFMVSLALALGLAEMTRGKTQIDSFFIDEGFGSLDEQTLESVADVLLGLRGRGKTIGVISHVEALTARLPRSLRLEKHSAGSSSLSYQEVIF